MMWLKYGAMLLVSGFLVGVIYAKGYQAGKHEAESYCAHQSRLEREKREQAYLLQLQSAEKRLKQASDKVRVLNEALKIQAGKNQQLRADYEQRLQSLQGAFHDAASKDWSRESVPDPVAQWVLKLQGSH